MKGMQSIEPLTSGCPRPRNLSDFAVGLNGNELFNAIILSNVMGSILIITAKIAFKG